LNFVHLGNYGSPSLNDTETIIITVIDVRPQQPYGWPLPQVFGGLYQQQYYWNFTDYQQQQLVNTQEIWKQSMNQLGRFLPVVSQPWRRQQQQPLVQPFALQSYNLSIPHLKPLSQPLYQYWNFTGYHQKQWGLGSRSRNQLHFTGYQQQFLDLQKQSRPKHSYLLNVRQQKSWNQIFQP